MIHVIRDKTNRPAGFQLRKRIRDRGLQAAIAAGISASQHWSDMRSSLSKDADILAFVFARKCGYCESTVPHTSYAHVDHFLPKSNPRYLTLVYEWKNWIYSCQICNLRKGTYSRHFSGRPLLINPTKDDPRAHFRFQSTGLIGSRSSRGKRTIKTLDLNREDLARERTTWLAIVMALALLQAQRRQPLKTINHLLAWCISPNAPYSAFALATLEKSYPSLLNVLQGISVSPGLNLRSQVRKLVSKLIAMQALRP